MAPSGHGRNGPIGLRFGVVTKASERLVWAVDVLDVQPGDRVLEVGCGHGVAVSLICERLGGPGDVDVPLHHPAGGSIVAIDQSPKMIEAATRRNAEHVASGKASLQTVALADADFGHASFDKVLAVHIGVFLRGRPDRELAVVARSLAPGGRLYVAEQPLAAHRAAATAGRLTRMLDERDYAVDEVRIDELASGRAVCVVASPTTPARAARGRARAARR
jgi:SAM-dependent methyltransferase